MRINGWVRLWIALTMVGVPAAAMWDFHQKSTFWDNLNNVAAKTCVDEEFNLKNRPDAFVCMQKQGAMKTVFEREGTTPAKYWTEALGSFFVLDLLLTAALIGIAAVVRWIVKGFRPAPSRP